MVEEKEIESICLLTKHYPKQHSDVLRSPEFRHRQTQKYKDGHGKLIYCSIFSRFLVSAFSAKLTFRPNKNLLPWELEILSESFGWIPEMKDFTLEHSERRWLATPKRWRLVRGHDKPRLMGVASHRSFPGGICCQVHQQIVVILLEFPDFPQKVTFFWRSWGRVLEVLLQTMVQRKQASSKSSFFNHSILFSLWTYDFSWLEG